MQTYSGSHDLFPDSVVHIRLSFFPLCRKSASLFLSVKQTGQTFQARCANHSASPRMLLVLLSAESFSRVLCSIQYICYCEFKRVPLLQHYLCSHLASSNSWVAKQRTAINEQVKIINTDGKTLRKICIFPLQSMQKNWFTVLKFYPSVSSYSR